MWCRYGYPALVALSPSKLKFAALRSAYELDAVKTFVNHVRQVRTPILDATAAQLMTNNFDNGCDGPGHVWVHGART